MDSTPYTPPSAEFQPTIGQALKSCRPLSDPVNVLALWLQMSALLPLIFITLFILYAIVSDYSRGTREVDFGIIIVFGGVLMALSLLFPVGLHLLVRSGHGEPVLFLRAFRTDRQAVRLRSLLKAALGSDLCLCGIRPPRERVSGFSRIFLTAVTGCRYLGSESFELEAADHNWLARLLATCAKARFVFVDVRDVTSYVADEIRMVLLNFGMARSVFVTDESRTDEQWCHLIRELTGLDTGQTPVLQLLPYPGDARVEDAAESRRFVDKTRALVAGIPTGAETPSQAALDFVRSRVDRAHWDTSWFASDWGQFFAAALLTAMFGFAASLLSKALSFTLDWITLGYAICVLLALVVAALAAWRRAWRQAKLGEAMRRSDREKNPKAPLVASIVMVAVGGFLNVALPLAWLPAFQNAQRGAMLTKSLLHGRMIGLACDLYSMDHDGELPPLLDALTPTYLSNPEALISPFAPDDPIGYIYYPGHTNTDAPETILIEDKYTPRIGQRVIIRLDTSGVVEPIK